MRGLSLIGLLGRPVRSRGIQLGRPVDALLDLGGRRAVGLDVLCGDDERRFLPLEAAEIRDDELVVDSAFALVEGGSFYRESSSSFRSLLGAGVAARGGRAGTLADVLVTPHGEVDGFVVEDAGVRRTLPGDQVIAIAA
jgi:hypothetical protein